MNETLKMPMARPVNGPTPHVNADGYRRRYEASVSDPEAFWKEQGERLDRIKPYSVVKNTSFAPGKVDTRWFEDGTLNVSARATAQSSMLSGRPKPAGTC